MAAVTLTDYAFTLSILRASAKLSDSRGDLWAFPLAIGNDTPDEPYELGGELLSHDPHNSPIYLFRADPEGVIAPRAIRQTQSTGGAFVFEKMNAGGEYYAIRIGAPGTAPEVHGPYPPVPSA